MQVASGRFGVTPNYLSSARQLEIKMAQGSKPGEGGHIPGHKVGTCFHSVILLCFVFYVFVFCLTVFPFPQVNKEIAWNRHAVEGTTLISPPPHHDIYSIEDIKQLIYDLKRINATAPVCVKLVSEAGVGTIAAGVVKGNADIVQISGNDGGTGASPLSSIKNAGLPWELGLAETQATLVAHGLRESVTLRVDGGLKTGRDVVVAAMLGAEEYGFGTAALVALGCVMARKCHLNTCPVGIATQDPELRAKFNGHPDHVVDFLLQVAHQVRETLAAVGARSLDDVVGRVDLLRHKDGLATPKGAAVDLSALLESPPPGAAIKSADRCARRPDEAVEADPVGAGGIQFQALDELVWRACEPTLAAAAAGTLDTDEWGDLLDLQFPIRNSSRSVGARLSGAIAQLTGDDGLPHGRIKLRFHGVAGQSFGAFCNKGMRLELHGEAHDFVGKSQYGGVISILPQRDAATHFRGDDNVIMGNTCLFGATGGQMFAAGRAGERFAVRNSGAQVGVCGGGYSWLRAGVVGVWALTYVAVCGCVCMRHAGRRGRRRQPRRGVHDGWHHRSARQRWAKLRRWHERRCGVRV